ncbi:hypothetical protein [Aneurinibacillus sp. REN35]|uniref:hypothetical protein n=1 Tax=Aneurinibacillus sp. REN35 TaxID=3237286 RepID=UPI003527506F
MKLTRKCAAFVLTLGIVGTAGAWTFTQPDVRADDSVMQGQPIQQPADTKTAEQPAVASADTYTSHTMGFSLRLPASWIGNYTVTQVEKNIDGFPATVFSNPKHSFELMQIVKIPASVWDAEGYQESLYMKLTERDGMVYAALFPSETLYQDDKEVTEITDMLNSMFEQLHASFKADQ